jgi:alpha-glucosidase
MTFMHGLFVACAIASASARSVALPSRQTSQIDNCPGYSASNVQIGDSSITADLALAGEPCNTFGKDLTDLKLEVTFENGEN